MKSLNCLISIIVIAGMSIQNSNGSTMTKYYVPKETDKTFKSKQTVELKTCKQKALATVKKDFAVTIRDEGSGRLKDNSVINLECCDGEKNAKNFDCFSEKSNYPVGSRDNKLVRLVSIAVKDNNIEFGSKVFVKELKGFKLPNGKIHNGCVRVDDDCGSCTEDDQIDLFCDTLENYELDFPEKVTYKIQDCKLGSY